ncbi:MAG: DUF6868 family protein [Planctomycetota bacterium]
MESVGAAARNEDRNMTMIDVANFLGWCMIFNFGLLLFTTLVLVMFRKQIVRLHGKWFDMEPGDLPQAYFRYLANFKLLIIVFNLVPYLALRMLLAG